MRVIIIGAGRMGSALAQRSVELGHSTRVLGRTSHSRSNRPLPKRIKIELISKASPDGAELILIAAPAWADSRKEGLITSFLRKTDKTTTICSTAAYAGAPTEEWSCGRRFTEMMCSAAIANTRHRPLVILTDTDRIACDVVKEWLGPANVHVAEPASFGRLCSIFIATAIHCESLRRTLKTLSPQPDHREKRFSADTLSEAFALLETFSFDPNAAFDACLTPRGRTSKLVTTILGATTRSPHKGKRIEVDE